MKRFFYRAIAFVSAMAIFCTEVAAKEGGSSDSSKSPIGMSASILYQIPTTGSGGFSLDLEYKKMLRGSVGASVYIDSHSDMNPMQIALIAWVSTIVWFFSLGHGNYRKIYNFINGNNPNNDIATVLSPFALLTAKLPFVLTPAVGIGRATWYADPANTRGLPGSDASYAFYSAGIELQGDGGYLGAGYTYAPSLPTAARKKPYINLGARFGF